MDKPIPEAVVKAAEEARVQCLNKLTAYGSTGVEERHLMAMQAALTAAQQQGQACGTCGEMLRPSVKTGTICACAPLPLSMQQGGGEVVAWMTTHKLKREMVRRVLTAEDFGGDVEALHSYGMAHDCIPLCAPPSAPVGVEGRLAEVVRFLMGEAPLDGRWFDDPGDPHGGGAYWWRKHLTEALAQQPAAVDEATTPTAREVARIGDMDQRAALRVGFDGDNDVYLSTTNGNGDGVEFCTTGNGGGKSPRTRNALIALMVAMEQDNAADPRRDWWAQRTAALATQHQEPTT